MNKVAVWCRRLLVAVLFVLGVAWVETQAAQWILRTRAQNLLADVRSLNVNHSRWPDAQQLIAKWGRWGTTAGDCNAEICIYRITQEALNNAARHSGGHRAWVKLEQTADRIAVIVRDDGHGFDSSKTRGMGLLGMEERVRRLGGKLELSSKPGEGTVLNAELPLQRRS